MTRTGPILLSALSTLLLCRDARALDDVEIGFGLLGNFGANFIDTPSDQLVQGAALKPEYPGFAGSSLGGGPMLDLRFFEYVGLEVDFFFQNDYGTTEITITNLLTGASNVFEIEMGYGAWHFPLLFKGIFLPLEVVTPVIMLGPEFVVPGDPELSIIAGNNTSTTEYGAFEPGQYTRFTFGFGIETRLPIDSSVVNVRIPLQVRGSYYPGLGDTRSDRETTVVDPASEPRAASRIDYKIAWEYQVAATLGAAIYF